MNGLEWTDPRGFALLGLLAPLVLLYILKVRRPRVRVGSVWLWTEAQRDLAARHPWRRLVAELPLIVQLLAITLLALALARPSTRSGTLEADHLIVVVDTSASMGARESDGTPRLEHAKRVAIQAVRSLAPGGRGMVIDAGNTPEVATTMERDVKKLERAIALLSVRHVAGRLGAAVGLAADRLRALGGRGRLVVVTDGAFDEPLPSVSGDILETVQVVGEPAPNVGIVRLDVRSGTDPATQRDEVQAFVLLLNASDAPRDVFATLTLDGSDKPLASRRIHLAPRERAPALLHFFPSDEDRGKPFVASVEPDDALTLDNRAFGRVPASPKLPVVLASAHEVSWLGRVLLADRSIELRRLTVDQLERVNVEPDALVVVEGACPASPPGRDVLIVAPPPGDCQGLTVTAPAPVDRITSWDPIDARLRYLTFDGVHVARTAPLEGGTVNRTPGYSGALLRAGDTILVADASARGRTVTVVGFELAASDWPLKASFVLFVRNVVELAKVHRSGGPGLGRTGEAARVPAPPEARTGRLIRPGGSETELEANGGFFAVPPLERVGTYRVRWTEPRPGELVWSANLTSEEETNLAPRAKRVATKSGQVAAVQSELLASRHEWTGLLALLAALGIGVDLLLLCRGRRAPAPSRSVEAREAS